MYACSFSSLVSFSCLFASVNSCICAIVGDRISAATIPRMLGISASFKNMSTSLVDIEDTPEITISVAKTENRNSFDKYGSFRENMYARSIERYMNIEINSCRVRVKRIVVFANSLAIRNMFIAFIDLAVDFEAISFTVNIKKTIVSDDEAMSIAVPVNENIWMEVWSI